MIPAKYVKPRIMPWNNDLGAFQIDRLTGIDGDTSLNKEKEYEIGRNGVLGYRQDNPSATLSLTQFEYGAMSFWRKLANLEDPASAGLEEDVTLEDLKTPFSDISLYKTDEGGTFKGTVWFPKLRVNGFSINIGDPDALIERSFDLIGEDTKFLIGKYLCLEKSTAVGVGAHSVVCSPAPIEYADSKYIFRVIRVRSGEVSELVEDSSSPYADNTWRYDVGTNTVIVQTCEVGDVIKVFYMADTADGTIWTDNDVDADFIKADQVEIYLKVGLGSDERVYRLQSVSIDASFDRADYKEIGNKEVVQTGVNSKTVTVTLGRLLEDFTVEEVLADIGAYPYIDVRNLSDDVTLTVKIFTDNTHSTFLMGYKITDLAATTLASADATEEYGNQDNTLEADNFLVTPDESEL